MKFALLYEKPVARPWTPEKQHPEVMHSIEATGKQPIPEFSH